MPSTKISQLPTASTVSTTDELPINVSGTTSKTSVSALGTALGVQTHIADATIHRSINDASTSATSLWSASKVNTELGTRDTTIAGKATKVSGATSGNFASLSAGGDLTDSGAKAADFSPTSHTHTLDALSDVTTSGATANQLLKFDGANWVAATVTATMPMYRAVANPVYASASTFTIANGAAMDSTGTSLMSHTASKTINIATSGVNGLDTGSEASATWYYLYMIGKTDGTTDYVLSVTNESASGSITLPSGYTLKRQMAFAVRNDGSSNFLPWIADGNKIYYTGESGQALSSAGPLTLLNAGTATSFTDVSCASVVPAISQLVMLDVYPVASINGRYFQLRPKGETHNGYQFYVSVATPEYNYSRTLSTNSSQQIQYSQAGGAGTGNLSLFCQGYIVTGVF